MLSELAILETNTRKLHVRIFNLKTVEISFNEEFSFFVVMMFNCFK